MSYSKTGHILCCKIFPSLHSMASSALFSVSPASGEGAPESKKEKEEELREWTEQEIPTLPVYTTHSLFTLADMLTDAARGSQAARQAGSQWQGKVPHSLSKQANAKIVTSSFCCLLNDVNTNLYTFHCFQEQKCIQICRGTLYLTKSRQI